MSRTFEHISEVKIIECDNFLSVLPSLVPTGNILLITSKGFSKRGLVTEMVEICGTSRVFVFDGVTPNPEKLHLQSNIAQFTSNEIAHVIALGGGSVIDAAKVFCAMLSYPDTSLDDLLLSDAVENNVNLIAIPTTSGTGAEVTPFATVWQSDIAKKSSLYGIRSNVTILDPSLTLSLPANETLYPALDALSHALESLWNKNKTQRSQKVAKSAIELICDALPKVLKEPSDIESRQKLQQAATLAGLAISITKTALAHAISYPLTLKYSVPHGLACSFSLLSILKIIGGDKLNLSTSLAAKIVALLNSFNLNYELAKFVDWDKLVENFDYKLDPSRTGNFIEPVDENFIKRVFIEVNPSKVSL